MAEDNGKCIWCNERPIVYPGGCGCNRCPTIPYECTCGVGATGNEPHDESCKRSVAWQESSDDDGFIPLTDFIPVNVSDSFHYTREMCKTQEHRRIWDTAVKECIKSVVLETKGFSLSQIEDLKWLLFGEWEWQQDAEFIKEAEKKGKYHTQPKPGVAPVRLVKEGGDVVNSEARVSMWQKVKNKVFW